MRVLFVCTGNICRSPAAHAVLEGRAARAGLRVEVDSAGISGWHAGQRADERARAEGARRGYSLDHRARKVRPVDLHTFDLVIAMDRSHLEALRTLSPTAPPGRIVLFRSFDEHPTHPDVADPYFRGGTAFAEMFDVIEGAMPRLLARIATDDGN